MVALKPFFLENFEVISAAGFERNEIRIVAVRPGADASATSRLSGVGPKPGPGCFARNADLAGRAFVRAQPELRSVVRRDKEPMGARLLGSEQAVVEHSVVVAFACASMRILQLVRGGVHRRRVRK